MIKKSAVFNYLSEDFREKALKAGGDDMARYSELLTGAQALMSKADSDLREANDRVVKGYKNEIKGVEKEKNAAKEKILRRKDERKGETLLKELEKT